MSRRGARLTKFRSLCRSSIGLDKSRDNVLSHEPAPEENYLRFLWFYEVVLGRQRLKSEPWPIRGDGSVPMTFVTIKNGKRVLL